MKHKISIKPHRWNKNKGTEVDQILMTFCELGLGLLRRRHLGGKQGHDDRDEVSQDHDLKANLFLEASTKSSHQQSSML